ncbi:PST family polysaccharide transporter [Levilactobacillus namurensis DSM 19117]|uniref:PST family polysaccharide transporter n=1 Tax=Levilactobacillus namurensis DSM 19117 TaxID=1423773 RepID=A0A0R1JW00_9LACO|nr:polysaccharide biosynthesis C-terminal domain-containing protein [Levilactobacillus namurensis]KRK72676.1 PST family polysaccharide transporter [Levilactobacillus namurensis DSM 19117]GEO75050.1 flippase [Levilactobacillus namurensis]
MQVVKNYLYNAFYQIFILLVPLITTPYLSRVLGPTGVGINAYTNSIIQYFILFGSVGVNLYGNRQIAFVHGSREKMTTTFYEIFFLRIITVACSFIAFLFFLRLVKQYHTYYWAQSLSLFAAAFDISWFFMGIENFAVTVLRNFVVKVLTLVSVFVFVKDQSDLGIYILILSMSLLLGNLTLFPSLRKYIGRPVIKHLNIWQHFLPSIALFIPQVATQIYLVVNKTMLGVMASVQASGYFDQSDKIIKMVLAIVTATGTVMLPHVANAFAQGKIEKAKNYLYSSFSFVSCLSIPMFFGVMAVADKFVPLFFTRRFQSVAPLMMIEAVVIVLIAWSNAIGTQYLLPTKQTRAYTTSVILGAMINIIINVPFILLWGVIGAAFATVLSEMTVSGYQLWSVRRQISYKRLFRDNNRYIIAGIVMFLCVRLFDYNLAANWWALGIEVLAGISVYGIMLFVLRVDIVKDAVQLFSHRRR